MENVLSLWKEVTVAIVAIFPVIIGFFSILIKFFDTSIYKYKQRLSLAQSVIKDLAIVPEDGSCKDELYELKKFSSSIISDSLFGLKFGFEASGVQKKTLTKMYDAGLTKSGVKLARALIDPVTGDFVTSILNRRITSFIFAIGALVYFCFSIFFTLLFVTKFFSFGIIAQDISNVINAPKSLIFAFICFLVSAIFIYDSYANFIRVRIYSAYSGKKYASPGEAES